MTVKCGDREQTNHLFGNKAERTVIIFKAIMWIPLLFQLLRSMLQSSLISRLVNQTKHRAE